MISREVFMDVIALHRQGYSIRAIARKLGIHRATVKNHLEDPSFPKYERRTERGSILEPYGQVIKSFLEEDHYQATWIFERLKKLGYNGSYDTVKLYVKGIKEQQSRLAYVRFETEPALQAQVDWGDFKIEEPDGTLSTVHAFCMVLGYSRALYVEFMERCTLEAFLDGHIHAFHYLQGTPAEILYDNLKNVFIGKVAGKVRFNQEFLHFAHHYGFRPKTCPPYSPWVKGKVERPMDYVRERFWRGHRYTSLTQTNAEAIEWLNEVANPRIHGTHHQRVRDRWQQEIACLGKLPPGDYDTSVKVFRKVYKDCQLSYNGNRYVVPHSVVGKTILLKVKNGLIRFYHDQEFLASYQEPPDKGNTLEDKRFYLQLKQDREQCRRKYGKGKAVRESLDPLRLEVFVRPLSEYEACIPGGGSWKD